MTRLPQGVAWLVVALRQDVPHLVVNRSGAPCRALVAHTAADDQAGIVLLPALDGLV